MKRQMVAILVLLALVLQGSAAAFATPSGGADAICTMGIGDGSTQSCCTHHSHVTSCCLDECASVMAAPFATTHFTWIAFSPTVLPSNNAELVSREDAPLIRPPIP